MKPIAPEILLIANFTFSRGWAEIAKNVPRGIRLELKITHLELANLIGSIRETVSATLGEFKNKGLIDFDGRRIVLLHLDRPKQKAS